MIVPARAPLGRTITLGDDGSRVSGGGKWDALLGPGGLICVVEELASFAADLENNRGVYVSSSVDDIWHSNGAQH